MRWIHYPPTITVDIPGSVMVSLRNVIEIVSFAEEHDKHMWERVRAMYRR